MLKMTKKLVLAGFIDCSLVSIVSSMVLLCNRLGEWNFFKSTNQSESVTFTIDTSAVVKFIVLFFTIVLGVFAAIAFKDFVFKNASIGKKIVGLIILDRNFNIPNKKTIVNRSIKVLFEGFPMIICDLIDKGDYARWELEYLGTRIVDKKLFEADKEAYIQEFLNPSKSKQ